MDCRGGRRLRALTREFAQEPSLGINSFTYESICSMLLLPIFKELLFDSVEKGPYDEASVFSELVIKLANAHHDGRCATLSG